MKLLLEHFEHYYFEHIMGQGLWLKMMEYLLNFLMSNVQLLK